MRLWSLHPALLDRQGLVACWREALLAQAVLFGQTRGYTNHPQLDRFRAHTSPRAAIGVYLGGLHDEASRRGYNFDATRILHCLKGSSQQLAPISVTFGQLEFELAHLRAKLLLRSPDFLADHSAVLHAAPQSIAVHPLFVAVTGTIEPWERT